MSDAKKCPVGGKGIGGQAVIEGVMMRGKTLYAMAVRGPEGDIKLEKTFFTKKRPKFWTLPLIRGVVAFVDSMVLGMKIISRSAEMAGMEDMEYDRDSKFERWLEDKVGDKLTDYVIGISVVLSLILSIGLFMVLPTFIGGWVNGFLGDNARVRAVIEGFVRIGIFLLYIILVSQMKDIKRVFMYHGAEHKTINCFESYEELTVENVRKHTRLHKRCGTSFLVLVMIVSMFVFFFVNTNVLWLRVISRILLVPVIAGISYELIKWAGSHDNIFVRVVSAPGLALQHITTKEPEDDMIECAIASLKAVLEEEPE
ncbi:MAG: DUF1385 domain-containing protein, partial [Firmicutes bacterium]|nr:DUF1385 domain-containing protein [Bacillota bacterium]